jgi:hypothetical protein
VHFNASMLETLELMTVIGMQAAATRQLTPGAQMALGLELHLLESSIRDLCCCTAYTLVSTHDVAGGELAQVKELN